MNRTEKCSSHFTRIAQWCATATGRPSAFAVAASLIVVWIISGPLFKFSDTWQLVINTGTTIITFLMVFLIQNSQNRDTHAIQIKLDELIRVSKTAQTALLDLEELSDEELEEIRKTYCNLAADARKKLREGEAELTTPPVHDLANQR